jgi:hypothetical protein
MHGASFELIAGRYGIDRAGITVQADINPEDTRAEKRVIAD